MCGTALGSHFFSKANLYYKRYAVYHDNFCGHKKVMSYNHWCFFTQLQLFLPFQDSEMDPGNESFNVLVEVCYFL